MSGPAGTEAGWRGRVDSVIEFWYGRTWEELEGKADPTGEATARWYAGGDEIDNLIREKFEEVVLGAAAELSEVDGKVTIPAALEEELRAHPDRAAAMIVCFDQFTRNIFRGRTKMFGFDRHASTLVNLFFDDGSYSQLFPPILQISMATVYMHSEDPEMSQKSMVICKALIDSGDEKIARKAKGTMDYSENHFKVVEKFGRFPHRNQFLGRDTTPEEAEFLRTEVDKPGNGWMKIMKKAD